MIDYDPQCLGILQSILIDFYHDLIIRLKDYFESIGSSFTFQVRPIILSSLENTHWLFSSLSLSRIGYIRTNTRRSHVHQSRRTFTLHEIEITFLFFLPRYNKKCHHAD